MSEPRYEAIVVIYNGRYYVEMTGTVLADFEKFPDACSFCEKVNDGDR